MATLFPEFEPGNGAENLHREETVVFGMEGGRITPSRIPVMNNALSWPMRGADGPTLYRCGLVSVA
jgi:hypothetical protein